MPLRRPTLRHGLATLAVVLVLSGLAWPTSRRAAWRAAYPHLPARVQAAPYLLRARLLGDQARPDVLPTAASQDPASPGMLATAANVRSGAATVVAARPAAAVATASNQSSPVAAQAAIPPSQPSPVAAQTAIPPSQSSPVFGRTAAATLTSAALPPRHEITGLRHEYQTWNNCGPATVSMALSAFGASEGQAAAARFLKPDPDDKNVSPSELAAYVRSRNLTATVRINGSVERLRALVAVGLPVIAETWFVPHPNDEMGHYRVVIGFDHPARELITMDSYDGPRRAVPYEEFDRLWRVFQRVYLVIYDEPRASAVAAILGSDTDHTAMYVAAAARAEAELAAAGDAFGWYNLGSDLLALGDAAGAVGAFDRARALGLPWRMLWYQFDAFAAYAAVGRWEDVLALAEANLRRAGNLEESLYWQGRALEARGDTEGAIRSWRQALAAHPDYPPAVAALAAATGR